MSILEDIDKAYQRFLEEPDEEGDVPSSESIGRAKRFLSGCTFEIDSLQLKNDISCFDGDLRISWVREEKDIRFIFPNSESLEPYVYHQEGVEYGIEKINCASRLVCWLEWLSRDS